MVSFLRLPTKTLYTPLLSPYALHSPPHLILHDFITRTILGEAYRSFSSSLCSFIHSPVTPSLLGPNIFLSTLFSNTLSSSLNVSDQVSHPYKTTGMLSLRSKLIPTTLLKYVKVRAIQVLHTAASEPRTCNPTAQCKASNTWRF